MIPVFGLPGEEYSYRLRSVPVGRNTVHVTEEGHLFLLDSKHRVFRHKNITPYDHLMAKCIIQHWMELYGS